MIQRACTVMLVVCLSSPTLGVDAKPERFFFRNCVRCHGAEEQNGNVRFDKSIDTLFSDRELWESTVAVLEAGEMPPKEASQPEANEVADVVQMLQERVLSQRSANPLKRITRAEYTNTLSLIHI